MTAACDATRLSGARPDGALNPLHLTAEPGDAGKRLDHLVHERLPDYQPVAHPGVDQEPAACW